MSRVRVLTCWVATAVAVAAGCAEQPGDDVGTSTTAQNTTSDCTSDGPCPSNSPVIATLPFIDLYVIPNQQSNAQGFHISHFLVGGRPHTLRVMQGRISGVGPLGLVQGIDLKTLHAQIWLRRLTPSGMEQYVLEITDVLDVAMWANSNPSQAPQTIEAYAMQWKPATNGIPRGQWTDLCKDAELPVDSPELTYGPSRVPNHVTFVFEGERINPWTRWIYDYQPNWFNLGCAGHALAKMYLMGHVAAAARLGYVTTMDERRTILKMFSADYCGTGYAFTLPGVPLLWKDHRGWFGFTPPVASIEARWTPTGVACLTAPRTTAPWKPEYLDQWPNGIIQAILDRCPHVLNNNACQNPATDLQGFHLITANR